MNTPCRYCQIVGLTTHIILCNSSVKLVDFLPLLEEAIADIGLATVLLIWVNKEITALAILVFYCQESTYMIHSRYLKGRKDIWSNMEGKGCACKKEAYERQ